MILHEWIAFYSTFLEYPRKWCTYSAIIIIIISGHDQSAPCLQHEQQAKWLWEVLLFSMTLFHHRLKVGTGYPALVLLHVHKPPANMNSPSSSSSSSVHIISLHCAYNMNSRQSGWAGQGGGGGGARGWGGGVIFSMTLFHLVVFMIHIVGSWAQHSCAKCLARQPSWIFSKSLTPATWSDTSHSNWHQQLDLILVTQTDTSNLIWY